MRIARRILLVAPALALLATGPQGVAPAQGLQSLDLSGEWYVLLHYKDSKSADPSITKFKDLSWSIRQDEQQIVWKENPYVIFDEGTEVERRYKMRAHEPWQPEGLVLGLLRKHVDVSERAERSKRLRGSVDEGFRSLPPISTGAANTLSFTRDWKLDFGEDKVRIVIVDSLGGSELLGEMEEATVFEITERGPDDELLGTYSEGTKSGTLRMIRSNERRVVK